MMLAQFSIWQRKQIDWVPILALHIVAALSFSLANALTRLIPDIPPSELTFLRSIFMVILIGPFVFNRKNCMTLRGLTKITWAQTFFAGTISFFVLVTWFWSIRLIPLADATAIFYIKIIFMALLSSLLIGENFRHTTIIGAIFTVFGILLITRPNFLNTNFGILLVAISGLLSAIGAIAIKEVARKTNVLLACFLFSLIEMLFGFINSIISFTAPSIIDIVIILFVSMTSIASRIAVTAAYSAGPLGRNSGFEAVRVLVAAFIGAIFFGESISLGLICGTTVIAFGLILMRGNTPSTTPEKRT